MSDAAVIGFVPVDELPVRLRIGALLNRALFGSLLLLVCLATILYGTSHPWWKALFVCFVMVVTIVAVVESLLTGISKLEGGRIVLPVVVLASFAFFQTLPVASIPAAGLSAPIWNAISADPYQTRFVVLQFIALAFVMLLLYRYASTPRRMAVLLHLVIGVAVLSAVYGILRQTVQRDTGFLLPILKPGAGYGQFINKNHFAFLMEMAFGVGVGLLASGGVKRQHGMLYVAALLPIWTALILSNSRGGILAMIGQLVIAVLLIGYSARHQDEEDSWLARVTRSRLMLVALSVALVFGLLAGAIWVGGDRLVTNFEGVGSEISRDSDTSPEGVTRKEIWRATLRAFSAHPVLGVGLGGYWVAITAHHKASGTMTPQEAHNDYLELLASGGVVGFAIGAWFAVVAFRSARRNLRSLNGTLRAMRVGAILGISGVALHSLFDFGLHMLGNALILAVLITVATARLESNVPQETN
jgi:hypothetical protein